MPHWPRPWGLKADAELQLIIDEEMKRAGVDGARNPLAINNWPSPAHVRAPRGRGERFLWPALSGEHTWCTLSASRWAAPISARLRTVARATPRLRREGPQDLELACPQGEGRRAGGAHRPTSRSTGPVRILVDMDMPGIRIRPIIACQRTRTKTTRCPGGRAHPGRPPARQGGRSRHCARHSCRLSAWRCRARRHRGHGPSARDWSRPAEVGALEDGRDRDEAADLRRGRDPAPAGLPALSDRMNAKARDPRAPSTRCWRRRTASASSTLPAQPGRARMIRGEKPFPSQLARDDPYDDRDYASGSARP